MSEASRNEMKFYDIGVITRTPWPHWTTFSMNSHEFLSRSGNRQLLIVGFESITSGTATQWAAKHVPRHFNSYDVLSFRLDLPTPRPGIDPCLPIGGVISYRPEGALTEVKPEGMRRVPPLQGERQVNISIHTNGASGEPLLSIEQVPCCMQGVLANSGGEFLVDRGEYVDASGDVRETLEVCWEYAMGRKYPYPQTQRIDTGDVRDGFGLPIEAYPWLSSRVRSVRIKPFAFFNANGPLIKLVKLDSGAELPAGKLDRHRFLAVMDGRVSYGAHALGPLWAGFGSPGDEVASMRADESALLWVVEWQAEDEPLPEFFDCGQ
jgi:hypothetical protein